MHASLRADSDDSSSPSCLCGAPDSDDDHRLDVRVADAERAVVAAQHRLHILRQREDSNAREHNSRRLHALLPPELLHQVARYVVAENPRAAPKLAAVCTSFRDIIHSSPDLWQHIHITQRDPDPAEIAQVYVDRSAGRPLSVTLRLFAAGDPTTRGSDDAERDIATLHERLSEARDVLGRRSHPAPDEWPPVLEAALLELQAYKARATAAAEWDASLARAMDIIFAEFHRCVGFEFRSTRRRPTELVADHIQTVDAPMLRELILHLDPTPRLPAVTPRRAPALSLVDIQGVVADTLPRFSGLSQLRVVNGTFDAPATPLAPLLSLLRANPDLEELCLQPLIPHTMPLPSSTPTRLSLPRLKRLHLIHNARVERLMNHIHLPALTELTLAVQPGCHSAPLRSIFQAVPYPALHTLRLTNIYLRSPTSDLAVSLRQLGTLRKLYISESILCESVLSTLADPEYCPLLEELVFDRCDGITHDVIRNIWRARGGRTSVNRGTNGQLKLGNGVGQSPQPRHLGADVRRSTSNTGNGAEIQMNSSGKGTLRSLVVRNSSTPLADVELGESVRVW